MQKNMTIVIDLDIGLTGFDSVLPFFYPLQQDGMFKMISVGSKIGEQTKSLADIGDEACTELRRTRPDSWQIIFLLDSSGYSLENNQNYRGPIADQIELIEKKIINFILDCYKNPPKSIFAVIIDSIQYDKGSWEPKDNNIRLLWQIDTNGYIKEELKEKNIRPGIFKESEIDRLDNYWDTKIEEELGKINQDDGVARLFAEKEWLANIIEDNCSKIKDEYNLLIQQKKNSIIKLDNPDDPDSKAFIEILEKIQKEFIETIEYYKDNRLGGLSGKNPIKKVLMNSLQNYFSLFSEKYNKFTFLRFEVKDSDSIDMDRKEYRKDLMRLGYLLIFIYENGDFLYHNPTKIIGASLEANNFYIVRSIIIDSDKLQSLMSNYHKRLEETYKKTDKLFKDTLKDDLDTFGRIHFVDKTELPNKKVIDEIPKQFSGTQWGQWKRWKNNTAFTLNDVKDKAVAIADEDWDLIINTKRTETKESNVDVREKVKAFRQKKKDALELISNSEFKEIRHEWDNDKDIKEIDAKVKDLDSWNPTINMIIITFISALFCFIIPYYFTVLHLNNLSFADGLFYMFTKLRYLIPCMLVILFGFVTVYIIKSYRNRKFKKLFEAGKQKAENIYTYIKHILEDNRTFITNMDSVDVAVKNLNSAKKTLKKAEIKHLQIAYHKTQLTNHIDFAEKFMPDNEETSENSMPDSEEIAENSMPDNEESSGQETLSKEENSSSDDLINYEKPPYNNISVYAPSSINIEKANYSAAIGNHEKDFESSYMPALNSILLTSDPLYNPLKYRRLS